MQLRSLGLMSLCFGLCSVNFTVQPVLAQYYQYGNTQQGTVYSAPGGITNYAPSYVNPYARRPGLYSPYPVYSGYPTNYPATYPPVNMWHAPSGYYYPWTQRAYAGGTPPIVIVEQGASQPAKPAVSTVFTDLRKFLDESKSNHKLSDTDYNHLSLRLKDVISKESMLSYQNNGTLDSDSDANIRKDLDQLGAEISQRLK